MKLTNREKHLMRQAFEAMYWIVLNYLEDENLVVPFEEEFDNWLKEIIDHRGSTVEQYIAYYAPKDTKC
jgi:hypothetical protein